MHILSKILGSDITTKSSEDTDATRVAFLRYPEDICWLGIFQFGLKCAWHVDHNCKHSLTKAIDHSQSLVKKHFHVFG